MLQILYIYIYIHIHTYIYIIRSNKFFIYVTSFIITLYYSVNSSYIRTLLSAVTNDFIKKRANYLYAIGKYTRYLCATDPTCHTHRKIYLYATQWHTRNDYKI
jgi:hypothetical protein